jgi:hypothetical protein
MKMLSPILGVALLLFADVRAQTPSINWIAQNLPPGLSVTRVDSQTAKVTGRPTTPGVYDVVYFPMVAGVAGDMRRVRVNVLPSGLNLPQFYAYQRRLTTGLWGRPTFRSGGGGWFFGTVELFEGEQTGIFSPNGQTFRGVALPPIYDISAVTFGSTNSSTTILAGRNFSNGNLATHRSLNQGAFQAIVAPVAPAPAGGIMYSLAGQGLSSIGTRAVLMTFYSGIDQLLEIHTLEPAATSWVKRASFPVSWNSFASFGVSFVPQGTGLLGAVRPLTPGAAAPPFLLRSTSATGLSGWSLVANPHAITSVAAGNGWFLGSSTRGVLRSTNGVNWVWASRRPVGPVVFSTPHNMFFSATGNSKEGIYWLNYVTSAGFDLHHQDGEGFLHGTDAVTANQTGAVCVGGLNLSTVFVPEPWDYAAMAVNVGSTVDFDLTPQD